MAAFSLTVVYRRLRNLRPNLDVVLRFAINAMSVQRAQNDSCWKRTWERRWAMVWTEYRRGRDQVCKPLHQRFPDALLGISIAVGGQIFQMDVYSASHPPTSSRPCKLSRRGRRAVVVVLISFVLEYTEST